jgi:hypothetical protein
MLSRQSIQARLTSRIDFDGRGHACDETNAIGNRCYPYPDGDPLRETYPGEYRIHRREALLVRLCIGYSDAASEPTDLAANDQAVTHQFDFGGIAVAD